MKVELTDTELNLILETLLFSCTPQLEAFWETLEEDQMLELAEKLNDKQRLEHLKLNLDYDSSDQAEWSEEDVADHVRCEKISKGFNLEILE